MDVLNSASRKHCEVWALQFLFLHSLKDVVPPSEACLYGDINWFLLQAQQQSCIGLSQSFPPKRDGKTKPQTGFHFHVQKRPVLESSDASLAKRPHFESRIESHPGGRKSAGGSVSASYADARKRGAVEVNAPDVSQSTASSSPLSLVFVDWYPFSFFGSIEKHYFQQGCA